MHETTRIGFVNRVNLLLSISKIWTSFRHLIFIIIHFLFSSLCLKPYPAFLKVIVITKITVIEY